MRKKRYADAFKKQLIALVAESFFGQLKRELPVKSLFKMKRSEARREVSNYIHWYNSERLHSSLDHMPPIDFERQLKVESTPPH